MIDQTVAVPAATAMLGALVGALGSWLAKRAEKAPDIQAVLTEAIAKVVEHYRVALDRSDEEASEARREAALLRAEIADMRLLIEAQTAKMDEQSQEIEALVKQVGSLEQQIVDMGGQPPARRIRSKAKEVQV